MPPRQVNIITRRSSNLTKNKYKEIYKPKSEACRGSAMTLDRCESNKEDQFLISRQREALINGEDGGSRKKRSESKKTAPKSRENRRTTAPGPEKALRKQGKVSERKANLQLL